MGFVDLYQLELVEYGTIESFIAGKKLYFVEICEEIMKCLEKKERYESGNFGRNPFTWAI